MAKHMNGMICLSCLLFFFLSFQNALDCYFNNCNWIWGIMFSFLSSIGSLMRTLCPSWSSFLPNLTYKTNQGSRIQQLHLFCLPCPVYNKALMIPASPCWKICRHAMLPFLARIAASTLESDDTNMCFLAPPYSSTASFTWPMYCCRL